MEEGTTLRVLAGFLLGGTAGFLMHRSDFCLAAAFRDLFLFRRTFLLRILVLYAGTAALLLEGGRLLSLLPAYPFPFAPASLAVLAGGTLFGLGMSLAGGCVVGTLYRAGAGNGPALATVAGIVAGSGAYAEVYPAWSSFAAATTVPGYGAATLPDALGVEPTLLVVPAALACLAFSARGWKALFRRNAVEGYLQPRTAALFLALLTLASCLLLGRPLGVTSVAARAAGRILFLLFPAHAGSLEYYRFLRLTGEGGAWAPQAAAQAALVAGIVAGALLSALSLGELRFRWKVPPRQYVVALAGGFLMGGASRMAFGCNVWHVLGGVPLLATGSLLFTAALLPGAWAGGKLQEKLL